MSDVGSVSLVGSGPAGESLRTLPRWQAASVALLVAFAALSGPGVAVNLATTGDDPLPGDPVTVRDYEVTYAEGVENGMVSVVDVDAFGETTRVTTSGVIVRSQQRHVWIRAIPKSRLAFSGRAVARVGGVGWQDRVVVKREGWNAVGGDRTYRITFTHDGATRVAYRAPPANASPTIDGRNVTIRTAPPKFRVAVTHDNETRSAPLPPANTTTTLSGLNFSRDGRDLVATRNDTRVVVAREEKHPGAS